MRILLTLFLFITSICNIHSQCPNNNTLFPPGVINMSCPGNYSVTCIQGGNYVLINVIAGNVYTFSTCGGSWDTEITLYNNATGILSGYNDDFCGLQSQIAWTASFTGQLRVLVDAYPCLSNSTCVTLNISCMSCNPRPQSDCLGAFTICSNASFNNNSNNIGCSQDLNSSNTGCLALFERQGTWYVFSPSVAGTLTFTISPSNPLNDYDFAIWGPYPTGSHVNNICPISAQPLRCSYSALSGNTGLDNTSVDFTEGAAGDKWVMFLNVLVGQVYVLYVDNFSQSGLSFGLTFGGTASLDCIVLPIELVMFDGYNEIYNKIYWTTASEVDNHHFSLERSVDLISWDLIHEVPGTNSLNLTDYNFIDKSFVRSINYYRLVQVDINGSKSYSGTIAIDNSQTQIDPIKVTDVMGREVGSNYRGVIIEYYEFSPPVKKNRY